MAGNSNLSAAVKAKKDEFYTQLTDIEKEMRYYKKHFNGKTVFCNCDDPFESNFFKYFVLNFNRLGLKKLIATCYFSSPIVALPIFPLPIKAVLSVGVTPPYVHKYRLFYCRNIPRYRLYGTQISKHQRPDLPPVR